MFCVFWTVTTQKTLGSLTPSGKDLYYLFTFSKWQFWPCVLPITFNLMTNLLRMRRRCRWSLRLCKLVALFCPPENREMVIVWLLLCITRQLPGEALVYISNCQIFTGNGNTNNYRAQLSNLQWMPNSVSIGFVTAMKMGSSRQFKRYLTT